jgi:hypothetical protein
MEVQHLFKTAIIFMAVLFAGYACTDTVTNTNDTENTEEQFNAVKTIVSDALSDQSEGFMASLYDLTAKLGQNGLQYRNNRNNRPWTGPFSNYGHTYDPETGIHTIKYRRGFIRNEVSKLLEVELQYLFLDAENGFIEFPVQDKELIETIGFNGVKSGHHTGPVRSAEFERTANWLLEGFGASSPFMTLAGNQSHTGSMTFEGPENTASRVYSMNFNLVDITIDKPSGEGDDLEFLVTGLIEYEIEVVTIRNGNEITRNHSGTIELNGDGTALLRVMGFPNVVRLYLATGETVNR